MQLQTRHISCFISMPSRGCYVYVSHLFLTDTVYGWHRQRRWSKARKGQKVTLICRHTSGKKTTAAKLQRVSYIGRLRLDSTAVLLRRSNLLYFHKMHISAFPVTFFVGSKISNLTYRCYGQRSTVLLDTLVDRPYYRALCEPQSKLNSWQISGPVVNTKPQKRRFYDNIGDKARTRRYGKTLHHLHHRGSIHNESTPKIIHVVHILRITRYLSLVG